MLMAPLVYKLYGELPESKTEDQGDMKAAREKMKKFMEYNEERYSKMVRNVAILQLIICFLNSLHRVDMFAVVVVLAFYAVHEKDKKALLAYLTFMFFSIILDMVWVSEHNDDAYNAYLNSDPSTAAFVVGMTIFGMILKFLVLYPGQAVLGSARHQALRQGSTRGSR